MLCPCNPNKKYNDCCQKAHKNINTITTAEALMRSRYSAFVLANIEYLQKSHHSSTRPSNKGKKEIELWTKSVNWLKLEVLKATKDTVEFKAFFMENGAINEIHENSKFCKENGHWVYLGATDSFKH